MLLSKIVHPAFEVAPEAWPHMEPELKAQTEERDVWRNGRTRKARFWKVGAIIPDPKAWYVRMGCAVPANDECNEFAGMSVLQLAEAQQAQEMVSKGIDPDDYGLYKAGIIVGYHPDGVTNDGYLPGPNWDKYVPKKQAEAEEEEDDE